MASSSNGLRQLPSGKWQASYYDPHGTRRFKTFLRKTDAATWRRDQLVARDRGDWYDPTASRVHVSEIAAAHLAAAKHRVSASTYARYDGIMRVYITPKWGAARVGAVTPSAVKAWAVELSNDGLSPATVRKTLRLLSGIMKDAVTDGRIARNPCDGVQLPKAREREIVVLTAAEVEALASAAGEQRLPVLLLAYTGLRYGEFAALTVRRVEFLRRRIHVAVSASSVNGRPTLGPPKSGKDRRVPVPAFLLDELAQHCEGKGPDDLLFPRPYDGGFLPNSAFRRTGFDEAAKAIGRPGLTPHALRHTAASLAIQSGANIKAVQRMLGHADASITLNRYGHLYEDDLDRVAERMDGLRLAATS